MAPNQHTESSGSLTQLHPELAKEWHPSKNGELDISKIGAGSGRKVWWSCQKYPEHEWEARVADRAKGTSCPYCTGRKVFIGFNDLATTNPEIAKEWHPTKNGGKKPTDLTRGSKKKFWWICDKDPRHAWEASILSRTVGNRGCAICGGKKVLEGFNDLLSKNPEVAKEWHPTKNGKLKASEISSASHKDVWWQCSSSKNHEWKAPPKSRTLLNAGCPICSGRKVLEGDNDLATTNPELAKEWHPSKNNGRLPSQVSKGCNDKVWWVCPKHPEHEYKALVLSRTFRDSGCPICSGHQTLKGFNDLTTTHAEIAKEWHPTKNGKKQPTDFSKGSSEKVWWTCPNDSMHVFKQRIQDRTNGQGCPDCAHFGFNTADEAWFYLMTRPGEQQIGITNNIDQRVSQHQRNGWTLIESAGPFIGRKVLDTETEIKQWIKKKVGLIDGTYENWSTKNLEIHSLMELKKLSKIKTEIF